MTLLSVEGIVPKVHPSAFVAENAIVAGKVEIGRQSSIWFGSVIRGDSNQVVIGDRTNVQDGCVFHVDEGPFSIRVGNNVTIGHRVTMHGCEVRSNCLVGIGAILLNGVVVESESMIAAGALLTPGTRVPSGVLMMGSPAKIKRELTKGEIEQIYKSAEHYVRYSEWYK